MSRTRAPANDNHPALRIKARPSQRDHQVPAAWFRLATAVPKTVQTKLQMGVPDDAYEREADRIATEVVQMKTTPCQCGGACTECREHQHEEPIIRRKAGGHGCRCGGTCADCRDASPSSVPTLHGGKPLPTDVRSWMEPSFGVSLDHVRIHTSAEAAASSERLHARAYTVGSDVAFASHQYDPHTTTGLHLLAHELTHVIQQGRATSWAAPAATRATGPVLQAQFVTPAVPGNEGPSPTHQQPATDVAQSTARKSAADATQTEAGSCEFKLCFLPLQTLIDAGVPHNLAYVAAQHVFIRWGDRSAGFTRREGESKSNAQVITPEPRVDQPEDRPYERCVTARLRIAPLPTPGQLIAFSPYDAVGDLISYGLDVVHGLRHCPQPRCALARYRIERMLTDDRRGLYDLFDENCETWARNVFAAACLEAPELRPSGLGNIAQRILRETTPGRLYHFAREATGATRPLPSPAPSPGEPETCAPGAGIPNTQCGAYLQNAWWLPMAYVRNASCACIETPNAPTANCVRKFLQDRVAATPSWLMLAAATAKSLELSNPPAYAAFVQTQLTPRIHQDHVDAYRACCCPCGPAPYWAWIGVTSVPVPSCAVVGDAIRHFGSCHCTPGAW